jgi:hypothetical protein
MGGGWRREHPAGRPVLLVWIACAVFSSSSPSQPLSRLSQLSDTTCPPLSPCDTKACHTNKNLAIYVSRDFFTQTNQKSQEKNLKIFGGHLTKNFCEVNLKIFVSRYLLFVIHCSKSQDFLS